MTRFAFLMTNPWKEADSFIHEHQSPFLVLNDTGFERKGSNAAPAIITSKRVLESGLPMLTPSRVGWA